jgi:hypothetical protein
MGSVPSLREPAPVLTRPCRASGNSIAANTGTSNAAGAASQLIATLLGLGAALSTLPACEQTPVNVISAAQIPSAETPVTAAVDGGKGDPELPRSSDDEAPHPEVDAGGASAASTGDLADTQSGHVDPQSGEWGGDTCGFYPSEPPEDVYQIRLRDNGRCLAAGERTSGILDNEVTASEYCVDRPGNQWWQLAIFGDYDSFGGVPFTGNSSPESESPDNAAGQNPATGGEAGQGGSNGDGPSAGRPGSEMLDAGTPRGSQDGVENAPLSDASTLDQDAEANSFPAYGAWSAMLGPSGGSAVDAGDAAVDLTASDEENARSAFENRTWYAIRNLALDSVLEVEGGGETENARVGLHGFHGGANQWFALVPTEDGYYNLVPANGEGQCVSVTTSGIKIGLCVPGSAVQHWQLRPWYCD